LHLLLEHAAAVGRVVVVEAVGQLLVLLQLGAEAFQFPRELLEAFVGLLGACFVIGL